MSKISVIIPVYNVEKYIRECLDSIMTQTLTDIEILCIDDGSTDDSLKILQEYAQLDQRFHVEVQENLGPATARNKGLKQATGEFVIFMDADDYYPESDVLETLYQKAKKNHADICGGELIRFDAEGTQYDDSQYQFAHEGFIQFSDYQNAYAQPRFMFKRSLLIDNNIFFPELRRYEDPVFFVQAMIKAEKFYAIKKVVYAYRVSHKIINWNLGVVHDTLKGLEFNLMASNQHNLEKLHIEAADRVNTDWFVKLIGKNLNCPFIYEQFKKTIQQINWSIVPFKPSDLMQKLKIDFKSLPNPSIWKKYDDICTELERIETTCMKKPIKKKATKTKEIIDQNAKVSVIIPVYNVEKYIEECLNSILNQTLKEIEIICIDDGSTDNSLNILQEYAQKDKRIHVETQQNQGPAVARNKGLRLATGEFVIFMDSDDLYPERDVLETLHTKAIQNKAQICGGQLVSFDSTGKTYDNPIYRFNKEGFINYIDYQTDYGYTRFLFKRSLLINHDISFPLQRQFEDPVFFVLAMICAYKFYAIQKTVYHYRMNHKKIHWDSDKIKDALKGFETNLLLSKQFGLNKLHAATAQRLKDDWFAIPIIQNLYHKSVLKQLKKTLGQIDWSLVPFRPIELVHKFKKSPKGWQKNLSHLHYKTIRSYLRTMDKTTPYFDSKKKLSSQSLDPALLQSHPGIKVSVIVPVYNVEKYLSKCLDSLLEQTHANLEIICVNDGSRDSSGTILKSYAYKDNRIKIIEQVNQGLSAARNTGLKNATAEYIVFVDSDDWIEPETISYALSAMLANSQTDMVVYGANMVSDDTFATLQQFVNGCLYQQIKLNGKCLLNEQLILDTTVMAWNKMYKKSIIDKYHIEFPVGLNYEDNAFFYKYILHTKYVYYINRYLYNYLQRPDSIMGRMINKKSTCTADHLKIFDVIYQHYNELGVANKYINLLTNRFELFFRIGYNTCPPETKKKFLKLASFYAKQYDLLADKSKTIRYLRKGKFKKFSNRPVKKFVKKLFGVEKTPKQCCVRMFGIPLRFARKQPMENDNKLLMNLQAEVKTLKARLWKDDQYRKLLDTMIIQNFLDTNQGCGCDIRSLIENCQQVSGVYYAYLLGQIRQNLQYLFNSHVIPNQFCNPTPPSCDLLYIWGLKPSFEHSCVINYARLTRKPLVIVEDSFLRSACTWADESKDIAYRTDCSFTVDDLTAYYDATHASRLETMLNDPNLVITNEQLKRARRCIDRIIQTRLTKYNHQPIYTPEIGRPGVPKVLVIDQSYGDMSIARGLANDETFKQMLNQAIEENPDADIIVKTHPDTIAGTGGYYTGMVQKDNIYPMTDPINPISLLLYADKVYVCTSQFGFEALMCGKDVHIFGMPFYAGWGLTHDAQKCVRRTRTRTLEEVFYIAYIMYTFYVNPNTKKRCEIEEVMDYLLEMRAQYFNEFNVRYELE